MIRFTAWSVSSLRHPVWLGSKNCPELILCRLWRAILRSIVVDPEPACRCSSRLRIASAGFDFSLSLESLALASQVWQVG